MPKKQVRLNLGCGVWFRKDFVNVDKYIDEKKMLAKKGRYRYAKIEKPYEFVKADIKKMPFPDEYADYVELMNTIEHFPMHEVVDYLKEIFRVMKDGAKLIILTNSFSGVAAHWLQMVVSGTFDPKEYQDLSEVIYGNQYGGSEGEVHRTPFTGDFMNFVLTQAGFIEGKIFVLPRGARLPTVGTVKPAKDGVARNDLLVAEVVK